MGTLNTVILITAISLLVSDAQDVNLVCPTGWSKHGDKCFHLVREPTPWELANITCHRNGGKLAEPGPYELNAFLGTLAVDNSVPEFWIGYNRRNFTSRVSGNAVDGQWSDRRYELAYFGHWGDSNPDVVAGQCVFAAGGLAQWYLGTCSYQKPYICQISPCPQDKFRCALTERCINTADVCDGIDNCGDGSDEANCGRSCSYVVVDMSVDIESPNFPSQYNNGQVCQWVLVGPIGTRIELKFTSFSTEEAVDVVEVRSGGQTYSTSSRLAMLSGNNVNTDATYISANNLMILRFQTDDSISSAGFSAQWTTMFSCSMVKLAGMRPFSLAYSLEQEISLNTAQDVLYCEGICLSQACAVFSYDVTSRRCSLLDQPTMPVQDSRYDLYVKRCPNQLGDRPMSSLPNSGGTLIAVTPSRQLGTPLYPIQLPGGLWVTHRIEAESEYTISVELLDADVGPQDYAIIYDGDSTNAPLLAMFTSQSPRHTVVSTSRTILVEFLTQTVTRGRGFLLSYRQGCNIVLNQVSGTVSSPGYNQRPYPRQTICSWQIANTLIRPLKLEFLSPFGMETNKDFVQVFSGSQPLHTGVGFTGIATPNNTLYTPLGQRGAVLVRMITSAVGNGIGFSLRFSSDCPQINPASRNIVITPGNSAASYGQVISVRCAAGAVFSELQYRSQASVAVTCQFGGTWDLSPLPECIPVYCGAIPEVANGFVISNTGVYAGRSVRYQCATGYTAVGSLTVICQNDGTWSSPPRCRATNCAPLPSVTNGRYIILYGSGTSFSTVVEYSCDDGYEVVGLARLVCGQQSVWSGNPPTCQKRLCNIPPLENGFTLNIGTLYAAGDLVRIQCNPGYYVRGANPYRCAIDDYPTCQDVDECRIGTADCQQGCTNTPGAFECSCYTGYRQNVNKTNTCLNINECDEGYCDQHCDDSDGGYRCSCYPGYELYRTYNQRNLAVLGEDGTKVWHQYSINHTCIRVPCPTRSLILVNGQVLSSQTSFLFGDTIRYMCNMGFNMTGSPLSTCLSNGIWDFAVPFCQTITCPPIDLPVISPPTPSKLTPALYREIVEYTCNMVNNNQLVRRRQCLYNRDTSSYQLVGDDVTCPVIDCGPPMQISGSLPYTLNGTLYPAQFFFNCRGPQWIRKGGSSRGDNIIRCDSDGKWDYGSLSCDGPTCLDPGRPLDGIQVVTSYEEYSVMTFRCLRPGYQPDNPTPLVCLYNTSANPPQLSWNGSVPVCIDVKKPTFSNCPSKVVLTRVHHAPGFPVPVASDNSGALASTSSSPRNYSPFLPVSTNLNVTYLATDHAGNTARCDIQIKLQDERPPEISGPNSVKVEITSANATVSVDPATLGWSVTGEDEPIQLHFDPPYLNLTTADIGRIHYISGIAEDKTGNIASSRIQVAVTGTKCRPWSLVVRKGTAYCLPKRFPEVGYTCDIRCDSGYGFYENINVEELRMECNEGQDWNRNVPECVALHYPTYRQDIQLKYSKSATAASLDCENLYRQQLNSRITVLTNTLTNSVCNVVKPTVSVALRSGGLNVTFVQKPTGEDIVIQLSMEISPKGFDNHPYTTCAAYVFRVFSEMQQQYLSSINPLNPLRQNNCPRLDLQYDGLIYNDFECHGHEEFRQRTAYPRTHCLECPLGYYTEDKRVCIPCKANTYRDTLGADYCPACPSGSRSQTEGARSVDECSRTCPEGMVSTRGVAPCDECPVNTYSLNTTFCASCAPQTFTRGPGKGRVEDCIGVCPPGTYSVDGLQPCTDCPLHTYQPSSKQTRCIACPDTQHTNTSRSVSSGACANSYSELCLNPNPCIRGRCRVAYYDYYCAQCPSGYTGRLCNQEINPCDSNLCHNGGTCIFTTSASRFRCDCPPGTTGTQCETVENNCIGHQCRNGGVCQDGLNKYNCLCPSYSGYSNSRCTVPLQPCREFACMTGTCTAYDNIRRKCFCSAGYVGDACDINIDECASAPCLHGGTCKDETNDFRCDCPLGYSGKFCEIRDNVCAVSNCGANGRCVDNYPKGLTQCVCNENFEERNSVCVETNHCDSDPCQNGGTCSNFRGGFSCRCVQGFEGFLCQHNIDDCASNPCFHDGICIDKVNGYTCLCTKPDTGLANCEDTKDNCQPFPCDVNHSPSCTDRYNDYECNCETGWTGKNCSERAEDLCAKSPCQHNSTCENIGVGSYRCNCKSGWTGFNCESPVNNCGTNSCLNNAACVNTVTGYYCRCPVGFRGDRCETTYDVCRVANHCVGTGSLCRAVNGSVNCSCPTGYSGEGCEVQVKICNSYTCYNGGTCSEANGATFTCDCVPGYTGTRCETDYDECSAVSCPTGQQCVDALNSYSCECPVGKFGEGCAKDIPYSGDLVFTPHPPVPGDFVDSGSPKLLNSTELTASFWVRHTGQGRFSPGTILTLYGSDSPDMEAAKAELLRIDGEKSRVSFSGGDRLLHNTPFNIADGNWHHVALTWDGNTGNVRLFIDKALVTTVAPYGRGRRLPQYGWVVLGGVYNNETMSLKPEGQFEGKLSRVEIIPRALDYPTEISQVADNTPPSSGNPLTSMSDGLLTDPNATVDYEGELSKNICRSGLDCPSNIDDTSSIKVDCPENQVVYGDRRVQSLTWTPPIFNNSYNVTSTHDIGDRFIWGTYYVTYVATDVFGESAVCTVRLVYRRNTCTETEPTSTVGGTVNCIDIPEGRLCRVECTGYKIELAQESSKYYSCNVYSMWGSGEQLVPFQTPACAKSEDNLVNALVRVTYSFGRDCESVEADLRNELQSAFHDVNSDWSNSLCHTSDCDAVPIYINCTGQYVEATFNRISDPVTSSVVTNLLRSPDDVLRGEIVDNNKLNFETTSGATPDVRSLEIILVPYCVPGTQLIQDVSCVQCGAGTYYSNSTGRCVVCEKGYYQGASGQFSCIQCGPGLTTPDIGTQSSSRCYDACAAGEYFSLSTKQCSDCPFGSYQNAIGSFFCIPCPLGTTTTSPKSTSGDQCEDDDLIFESTTPVVFTEEPSTGQSTSGTGLTDWSIAAIVLAVLFFLLLLLLLLICCCRDRLAACLPCCATAAKVKPTQDDKWRYMSRYGASNDKYVNYKLSEVREKKLQGGLPQSRWTFQEDKAFLMKETASVESDIPPQVANGTAPVAAVSPPILPPLPLTSVTDESPKRRKKRSKKHRRHRHSRKTEVSGVEKSGAEVPDVTSELAVTETSGKAPVALPPIPSNELGNPMKTSFAYCFERTSTGFQPSRPKTEISNVHYSDFITEKQTSTPRSIPMRNGNRIMVDSDEEDYR